MTDAELIAGLTPLAPFKKIHYSVHYAAVQNIFTTRKALLEQVVRLNRSFSISVEWPTDIQIQTALELCPKYNAKLCLDSSPWQVMQAVRPPLRANSWGSEFVKDINNLLTNLQKLKTALGSLVPSISMIDHEIWNTRDDDGVSLDAKTNLLLSIFKEVFPNTDHILYDRGGINFANIDNGWTDNEDGPTSLREPGDYYCCNLYNLSEVYLMEEVVRRNIAAAKARNVSRVIPWVALGGCGVLDKLSWIQWDAQSFNRDYPLDHSYRMGAAINQGWLGQRPQRFFDNTMIPFSLFWPTPLTCAKGPDHYLSYSNGANLK